VRLFSSAICGRHFRHGESAARSSWLRLPSEASYKEIFNSSWPSFEVEFERQQASGGSNAQIYSGGIINLP
jgi:hypothetical protein